MKTQFGLCLIAALLCLGCGPSRPKDALPPLHVASGSVINAGTPVVNGSLRFAPSIDSPATRDLVITSPVSPEGTFSLDTLHATSLKKGAGAPAGDYMVTYMPHVADQTASANAVPVTLPLPVSIKADSKDLIIDIGAK